MCTLWRGLENLGGWRAVPGKWQRVLGADYGAISRQFLMRTGDEASCVPSKAVCRCSLRVVRHSDEDIVGISKCETSGCNDVKLSPADIELLEMKPSKLARELATAFGWDFAFAETGIQNVRQIGTYGPGCLPIILAIPQLQQEFSNIVWQLIGRYNGSFVLLTPSNRCVEANALSGLRRANAGYFVLETLVSLAPEGGLRASCSAQELLAPFAAGKVVPDSGFKKTVEAMAQDIAAIARNQTELRTAKERLEQMQGENLLKFVQAIDYKDFRAVCAILLHGDVAKASRAIEMKDSTLRLLVKSWEERGGPYKGLSDLVRWRKANRIRGTVPFNDALLYQKDSGANRESILSEVLDGLMSMTNGNWQDICEELKEVLQGNI